MSFIKAKHETLDQYLCNLQQDLVVNSNTVHDEVDLVIEDYLLKPLLKKLISKMTAKNIMDRFGLPYMNFLYDTEFNPKSGAFSGEGYKDVDGFSPYEYSIDREEKIAREEFLKVINSFKEKGDKKEIKIKTFTTTQDILVERGFTSKKLKKYIVKDEDKKGYVLKVKGKDGKTYIYPHKVSKKLIKILQPL